MEQISPAVAEIQVAFFPVKGAKPVIRSSDDAHILLRNYFEPGQVALQEKMVVLYLNNANEVIASYRVSAGGITSCIADVRLILSTALKLLSTGFLIAHNHPSGRCQPSSQDIELTRKLQESARLMDIKLIDHVILMPEPSSYYSFADSGFI